MKALKILIDMDDVLHDLCSAWITELNKRHGTSVTLEDVTDWEMKKFFPSLSQDELFSPLFAPYVWENVMPIQNAQEIIQRLKNDGHTIRIVTASHYGTLNPKMSRFLELYPCLSWKDVIIASDKSLIYGDVMIDDGIHNLEDSLCQYKILFDRPHNRAFKEDGMTVIRAKSWNEIYEIISKIAGGNR